MLHLPPNVALENVNFAHRLIFLILKVFLIYLADTVTNILKSVPSAVHQ
jgi:hypothetical protein